MQRHSRFKVANINQNATVYCTYRQASADDVKYDIFRHPTPIVQKRILCFLMKSLRLLHKDIVDVTGCCCNTEGNYLNLYKASGFEGLKVLNYRKPMSQLEADNASGLIKKIRLGASRKLHLTRSSITKIPYD
jgi:hypothetical protein